MYCTNCGKQIFDSSKFCANCGASIPTAKPSPRAETSTHDNKIQTNEVGFEATKESMPNKIEEKGKLGIQKTGIGIKKIFQIIAAVFFIAALSTISSSSNHKMEGWLADVYNFFTIASAGTLIGLVSVWWKNRNTDKKWFGWHAIIFLILLSMVGLGTTIFSQALTIAREKVAVRTDSWPVYSSESPYFTARFPSPPEHTTTSQDLPTGEARIDSYKSANGTASIAYVITVTEFPPTVDFSDSTGTLERVLNTSVNNIKGQLISSNLTTNNGFPAMNYVTQSNDKEIMKGLNVLVGQRVYQLITAYDSKDESKLEFDKFINSFSVK